MNPYAQQQIPSVEYMAWCNMRQRCLNPKNHHYKYYGGRGIKICDRWLISFENFLADVGKKPHWDYVLDRIDNDGNYEPGNIRWTSRSESQKNQQRQRSKK